MKVALGQMDVAWEDRAANFAKAEGFADAAKAEGADLLVLPEMFATGFSMNPALTAEPEDGGTARFLCELAASRNMSVVAGVVFRGGHGKGRNTALVINRKGEKVGAYAKSHLFSFMQENRYHEAGTGPVTFSLDDLRAGHRSPGRGARARRRRRGDLLRHDQSPRGGGGPGEHAVPRGPTVLIGSKNMIRRKK